MSAYERDPAKRKVKPVETAKSLLDFDLEESSDDSDFRIEDHAEESDDCSLDSDDPGRDGQNNDEEDYDSDDDSDDCLGTKKPKSAGMDTTNNMSVNDILERAKLHNDFKGSVAGLASMLICAGCLGSRSDDSNEIVECDGCGVTVHEGCYGVSDVTSESSTVSSASTEPWFCEACKAGVVNPSCELCPNSGGIFKETEVGAWVHLVCALYVPGVAFSEVEKLSGVTLFEMAYSRWGAKTCCLCEDEMFSRTGICIGCDAGMCRTYFHVTCGQREGLLAEAHSEEVEQADPFYAHCKLHSDKTLVKKRKRNWLALQLRTHQRKHDLQNSTDNAAKQRTQRKLEKCRRKFIASKEIKNPPWVPTQKMPRLLPTSASACRKLLHKASLMGIDTVALELQDAQLAALQDVRKKWHIPPAFSVEFIGYYLERNSRMQAMKRSLQELMDTNTDLVSQQKQSTEDYERATKEKIEIDEEMSTLKQQVSKIHQSILAVCPTKAMPDLDVMTFLSQQAAPVEGPRRPIVPTAAALKMGVGFPLNSNPDEHQGKVLSTAQGDNMISLNNECGICGQKTDQHLLAKCDTCHLYYHLGCLKPPLTRLPKKSKLYGWQCSECDKSSDSEAEILKQKVVRRSRTRYSKDGTLLSATSLSPNSAGQLENKPESKPTAETHSSDNVSSLKVKIKPIDRRSEENAETDDIFTVVQDKVADQSEETEIKKPPSKREKKAKRLRQKQDYAMCSSSESINVSPKKSRKRSFTSPALTNTPLMSITPIVAESPHESPSQMDCSNPSSSNLPIPPTQLPSDLSFLSPNSTFSTLLASGSVNEPEVPSSPKNGDHDHFVSYKLNRKRRKEKHRSRYSPDLLRSPSKTHKHKRKKKSQDMENPDIPHPRITIKIKPIPKPAGSVDPQLFYVPTDSNDGPPPALVKKSSKQRHEPEAVAVFDPPVEAAPQPPAATPVEEIKPPPPPTTPKATRKSRVSGEGGAGRRSAGTAGASSGGSEALTQCDVCSQPGTALNLVRCDECAKRYHFTCLEPPLNKNPKKRGYSWHCADCDPSETDSN